MPRGRVAWRVGSLRARSASIAVSRVPACVWPERLPLRWAFVMVMVLAWPRATAAQTASRSRCAEPKSACGLVHCCAAVACW